MSSLTVKQRETLKLLATGKVLYKAIGFNTGVYYYIRTELKDKPFVRVHLNTYQALVARNYIKAIKQDDLGNSEWVITSTGRVALLEESVK
jgi:hypothetical protein